MKIVKRKTSGQVWIETVLYTIIGLTIISIVLAFVMPKINQSKDNVIAEQSIGALKSLDEKIKSASDENGQIRRIDFNIKRGYLYINATGNKFVFVIDDLSSVYSEPDVPINEGSVQILTKIGQKKNSIYLILAYSFNITYNGKDEDYKLTASPLSYKILIENKNNNNIDLKIE